MANMRRLYHCANCGSAVRKNNQTFKVQVPAVDQHGKPKFSRVKNMKTGEYEFKQRMVEKQARGLGHWQCLRRCLGVDMKTKVKVTLVKSL